MILLNVGLEDSPGWNLIPNAIKEAYLTTPPFGGKKILLHEEDFSLTPDEKRDVFILCHTPLYYEWRSLDILIPEWRLYPHAYMSSSKGSISPQEMFENLITKREYPLGFVDHNKNVIYF